MKKITLLFLFVFLGVFAMHAQEAETVFSEDFDEYATGDQPDGWTILDEDGDGNDWIVVQFEQEDTTPVLVSDSWNSLFGPLFPDNYAITPAIDLTGYGEDAEITLQWDVMGVDPNYSNENYTVYVATENSVDAFLESDVSFTEIVTDNGPGGLDNPYTKTLDISSFAGETVYVALRHHDVTDVFRIAFDNVMVEAEGDMGVDNQVIEGFSHFITANKDLTIRANSNFEQIEIYNLLGQRVVSENLSKSEETISLSNLNSGVYIAKVVAQGKTASFKIAF